MQTVWSFLTFLADALSNTMKMIQTFFTKVHTWKDTVHSNYTAILMRKEGENRHHFSYCCWCLIIIKSFQKENSHALVLHCQMQMLLFLLVKLSLFGRQKRACGSENHHFLQNTFQYQSKCLIWIFHLFLALSKVTFLVTLFDHKLQFFKNSSILNETFSVIFKHRVTEYAQTYLQRPV